ncbi:hypothetical protein [Streptosporangium lutulentum]|uniref:Methyl-accepting chemotaxis protein n=1 Tax=Streptosporangium lutulentum TaxID=1461250 RepID=A0ABT9QHX0_9ACTN|nr:hypothetical protein [Streptosporangium lutulentum]MDP9846341.1 methyl-accepting chemotaxis protein [Streptosporangium lutulentum]
MSRFVEELKDAWGLLLGATAAGSAWAVDVHPAAAGFVGVAVWLTKAGIASFQSRGESRTAPAVTPRSQEAGWLERARSASHRLGELSSSMKPGPLADRVALMRPQVNDSMATLERLAEQASLTGTALAGFDLDKLKHEHAQLTRARKKAKEELLQDLDRALASLSSQRAVADRLSGTRERVLARMESSTISIEELLARVVELSAMSATGALEPTGALDELADALEGVRQGLHETEQITRDALDR